MTPAVTPAGAVCVTHPTSPATGVCTRCGAFMCTACAATGERRLCAACRARGVDPRALAKPYRNLVLWFGVQLLLTGLNAFAGQVVAVSMLVGLGFLATFVALMIYAYQTSRALGSKVPALWSIAMFVPCLNAITLLALSARATSACREAGIPVGLLGPKL